jgi:hypothetical protein
VWGGLQSSDPLWVPQEDATLATASIAVGAHAAKASQPMAVNAETGVFPFSLKRVVLLEPGLGAAQVSILPLRKPSPQHDAMEW